VVDALALRRDPSRGALVQVLFNVFNFAQSCLELPGIEAEQVPAGLPGAPFDLTTYLVERDGRFRFELVYNPDLYSAGRIDALLAGLVHLLGTLVASPHQPVGAARLPNLPALRAGLTGGEPPPGARSPLTGGEPAGGEPAGRDPGRAGPGAPRPTERIISEVWCVVLGRPRVSLTDSFFDLGGKSLDLVTVAQRLAGPLGRELRVVDLFRYPSVRALAAFVDGTGGGGGLQQATQRGAARREHARRRTGRHNGPTGPGGRP
jgi:hypothetical protein